MKRHNQQKHTKEAKCRWWNEHGLDVQRRYNLTEKSRQRIRQYQRSPKGQATIAKLSAIRRASKNIEASLTSDEWQQILEFHQFRCVYCGCHPKKLEQDHVIPVTKGGQHTKENVVPACRSCNARKNSRLLHH